MELLETLCRASGVSGFEDEVKQLMKKQLGKHADEVIEDSFGNVIARKGAGDKKIMLAAHMDEIGFMVKHVTEEGYLNFIKVGGIDNRILLHQKVIVKTEKGDVEGVIGSKPPHLMKDEERKKVVKHDEMFIDIGCRDKKEAEKKVSLGDPIIFSPTYGNLSRDVIYGKAVDDRVGCWALIEILKKIRKNIDAEVYACATTQEEVGLKGARVAAYKINPDYAVAIDTTLAGDTPNVKPQESNLKLGEGPALTVMEASGRGVISHPKLHKVLCDTSKKKKIPTQIDILEGGMTDAAIIYLTREGIPSSVVSIPTRYIHGPLSVFNLKDAQNTVKLIASALPSIAKL
ncbi:MAG: M20/M25/M40 family metallo-hydrolase [Candidatus Altiarchaeales archaeon]|nr:M20/M25/M40 family metallo-hydrolase [Candidatus Altiarchaeales archaeon]